ncbi:unnamed protein product [Caenorhabditis angaria]|uniref:Uncharacterized protein n=1 Tax=Caenorhabditis angaria TaxID=860376 RepID=A0A9P1I2J6_9PELO|nr:unnamed protein product [Caenorhabditis angaria]
MSLPAYSIRQNESNPTILKTLQFLDQANVLLKKDILTGEQKKILLKKVGELIGELNRRYKLDEDAISENSDAKRMESLKMVFQQSLEFAENRKILDDLSKEILEVKFDIQKTENDIRSLSSSVAKVKNQIEVVNKKQEKRKISAINANFELEQQAEIIRKNLENSTEVGQLRHLEEEQRSIEKDVENLKIADKQTLENIRVMKATLKAETKKPFVKLVVEIAKQHRLYNVLMPKLEKSRANVEKLKEEEAKRRASGNLDDTILFDDSFVKASQEAQNQVSNVSNDVQPAKKSVIPQVRPMTTSQSTEQINTSMRSINSMQSETRVLPPAESVQEKVKKMNSENTTLEQDADQQVQEEEEEREIEFDNNMEEEVVMEEEEEEERENPIVEETQKEAELNVSKSGNNSKNNSGFFNDLLAKKGDGTNNRENDSVLNVSSGDENGDFLNGLRDDEGQSQASENFSFNLFGSSGAANGENNDLDFDFNFGGGGSGSDNDDNFNLFGAGDSPNKSATGDGGAKASSSDPFGFGKSAENTGFSFNFDDAGSSGNDGGNSSFFNF